MLKKLYIKNYALIKELEVDFDSGFNIITGETGAGKSIVLGALGLLKGERADTKVLLDNEDKCLVEVVFDVSGLNLSDTFETLDLPFESECIIRREIAPNGRSRAFVNDTPVTLDVLSNIGFRLFDIHSQHDTLLLEGQMFQLKLIDTYSETNTFLEDFQEKFYEMESLQKNITQLEEESLQNEKNHELNKFLLEELIEANIKVGEESILKSDLLKLENAEDIKLKLNTVKVQFEESQFGVLTVLRSAINTLDKVSSFDEDIKALRQRLYSCFEELKDIFGEIENKEDSVYFNDEKALALRNRLDQLYSIQSKHRSKGIEDLIELQKELERQVLQYGDLGDQIIVLKNKLTHIEREVILLAHDLSNRRLSHIGELSGKITSILKDLSMPNAELYIEHKEVAINKFGKDQFEIMFSANKGIKPQKLKNAASGGEFSRLMLSLKHVFATKKSMPTIIFDEIDTGVSGDVALKMAQIMKKMALNHQVITITHLPQIAAFGRKHFFVYKDDGSHKTTSKMKVLSSEERIGHLAEMIGGKNPSTIALASAKELLEVHSK